MQIKLIFSSQHIKSGKNNVLSLLFFSSYGSCSSCSQNMILILYPLIPARKTCGPVLQAAEHGRTDLGFIALRCV